MRLYAQTCEGEEERDSLCYPITANITTYLNLHDVRKTLGVDRGAGPYSSISYDLHYRFVATGDMLRTSSFYVAGLLERDIKVLIYAGE